MNAPNRAALITRTYEVLRKHYQPVAPPADRSVLEHLLYACCLETGRHQEVDDIFAKLQQNYFDWNEVRVTTAAELAEVMSALPDAADAAKRLKRSLQSVFETHYSFDIEFLKKQNLGEAIIALEKFQGVTPFAVAYVTQNALGGHAIPVNAGVFGALVVLGVITQAEADKRRVPGMERTVGKSSGVEFASLLHQLGVDFSAAPFSSRVREILLEIAPDAKGRFPKRGYRQRAGDEAEPAAGKAKTGRRRAKDRQAEQADVTSGEKKSTSKRLSQKKPR